MSKFSSNETGWIAWFVYNPVAANLLMVGLLVSGILAILDIRTEEFPASAPSLVTVAVTFDGGTPDNVEEGAVVKIEEALSGVEGVYHIISTASAGGAVVNVQGVDGYPIKRLKDEVESRVDSITTFPDQVEQVLVTEAREEQEVLNLQVFGNADHSTLKEVASRIRERLLALPSINSVVFEGVRSYEITIEVSDNKLREYGLTFSEISDAISGASLNLSAGDLQTSEGRIVVQSRQQIYHGVELERVVVRSSLGGGAVRVSDVATVRDGYTDQAVLSTFQDKPSVGLNVILVGRDSIIRASSDVIELVERIETEEWLPTGVALATWANEAESIQDSLTLLSSNAMIGMALVLLLLALFLDPKVAFWVAVGIPVSFAGTFFVIGSSFFDYSVNNLTVLAFIVVLGIVVDDAIVIAENVYTRRMDENGDVIDVTIRGARDVATPATFGVLTTVAAFLPLAFITGNFGGPFRLIAVVTIICLLFSLVESKLILPAHLAAARFSDPGRSGGSYLSVRFDQVRRLMDRGLAAVITQFYVPLLKKVIVSRYQALAVFLAIIVGTVGLVGGGVVNVIFFGEDNDRILFASVRMPPGTAPELTHDIARRIQAGARAVPGVLADSYNVHERPIIYERVIATTDTDATIAVQLRPGSEREFLSQEFLDVWREQVGSVPHAESLSFYVEFEDDVDLRIELTSDNGAVLDAALDFLASKVGAYEGIRDLTSDANRRTIELDVILKPEAYSLGLTYREVIEQIRGAVFGLEVQRIQRNEEEVRVKVRYLPAERDDVGDLRQIRIRLADGNLVSLSQIASFRRVERPVEIQRLDGKRVVALTGMIDERLVSPSGLLSTIEKTVFPQIRQSFPGVGIQLAGESEAEADAIGKLTSGFIIGLLVVYGLLAVPLKSYTEPLVILIAVPYGIVGAIMGHLLMGIPISFLSLFGVLALTGVVVNDALILVSRYNQERDTCEAFEEAIFEAGRARFRAVFLTSITAFFGLLPLILEKSEQAQELIPMAVSLAFGILFATGVTLLIIPVLLAVREDLAILFTSAKTKEV